MSGPAPPSCPQDWRIVEVGHSRAQLRATWMGASKRLSISSLEPKSRPAAQSAYRRGLLRLDQPVARSCMRCVYCDSHYLRYSHNVIRAGDVQSPGKAFGGEIDDDVAAERLRDKAVYDRTAEATL